MAGSSSSGTIPTLKQEDLVYETDFEKAEILAQKMSENSKGVNNSKKTKKTYLKNIWKKTITHQSQNTTQISH